MSLTNASTCELSHRIRPCTPSWKTTCSVAIPSNPIIPRSKGNSHFKQVYRHLQKQHRYATISCNHHENRFKSQRGPLVNTLCARRLVIADNFELLTRHAITCLARAALTLRCPTLQASGSGSVTVGITLKTGRSGSPWAEHAARVHTTRLMASHSSTNHESSSAITGTTQMSNHPQPTTRHGRAQLWYWQCHPSVVPTVSSRHGVVVFRRRRRRCR